VGRLINGIMTLSGAWHKLRTEPDPEVHDRVAVVHGMSTFEGPMMSIKTVNSLSHYTDWTIATCTPRPGWVAIFSIGTMYALIPKLFGASRCTAFKAHRRALLDDTIRRVLYLTSCGSPASSGLMWRATNDGTAQPTRSSSRFKSTYPTTRSPRRGTLVFAAC